MNILVTGAKGFIGKNLCATLEAMRDGKDKQHALPPPITVLSFDVDSVPGTLDEYCARADFVVHLAGVNRPRDSGEFAAGNTDFTLDLLETLDRYGSEAPVLMTSSIQADMDNPYGRSKKAAEDAVFAYGVRGNVSVYVYRLPNVFGKWCRPNYNSAVATFCHNTARGLPITVNDPIARMRLVYVDDVIDEIIGAVGGRSNKPSLSLDEFSQVKPVYDCTLGFVADTIRSFQYTRDTLSVPDMADDLTRKLYATYISYLPGDSFSYALKMNADARGSFTEIIRTPDRGQFSVNITKPGVTKGNHWHHTKTEKFLVVSGQGAIRFRKIGESRVFEYRVSGDKPEAVDIPAGYTHSIENTGSVDLVTFMWCNELFDPDRPDTYYEQFT
ncbi:MAG: NAD-dependent epimerase/dehydratase family protein [Oscillospiraceae bacterium]|jgi:UDP-2-acetamido-2,6-beta-L-arabino-hexul-4-ose reductase|nr:NAD-dependent epimerase/dehydratase family protein [Oscillospiraceae bacterium]